SGATATASLRPRPSGARVMRPPSTKASYCRAVSARNRSVGRAAPSCSAATFIVKPAANVSGSTTSEPGGGGLAASSARTRSKLASRSSQTTSGWTSTMVGIFFFYSGPFRVAARGGRASPLGRDALRVAVFGLAAFGFVIAAGEGAEAFVDGGGGQAEGKRHRRREQPVARGAA